MTSTPNIPTVRSSAQLFGWTAIGVSIGAWTIHIVASAALVRYVCEHPNLKWVMHALTVGLALVCVGCILLVLRTALLPGEDAEDSGSTTANVRFLSRVAAAVAAFNLVLIVVEGIYVVFLHPCHG